MKPHYKIHYDMDKSGCASCAFNDAFLVEGTQACPTRSGILICENTRGIEMTWFERITPVVSTPPSPSCELNRAAVAGRPVPFSQRGVATQDCIDALLLAVTFPVGLHYAFQWLGL